jgi:proline iminopeptidase
VKILLALALATSMHAATFRADDGTVLHYDVAGKGDPVVLLSGGPGFSPGYLRPIADHLASKYSCILFHQRGTGLSTMSEVNAKTLALGTLTADLEALRRELKVEKLTIVAHSWGGILTMLYLRDYPGRIGRLVLVDAGGPTWQSVPKFAANLEARMTDEERAAVRTWSSSEKVAENRKRAVYELTKARTPAYFADRSKAASLLAAFDEDAFNDQVFLAIAFQISPAFDLRAGLKDFTGPVLVIHGRQDPLETAQEVHDAFPTSRLEILDDAGHFPWLEQPERFYAILDEFMAPATVEECVH